MLAVPYKFLEQIKLNDVKLKQGCNFKTLGSLKLQFIRRTSNTVGRISTPSYTQFTHFQFIVFPFFPI